MTVIKHFYTSPGIEERELTDQETNPELLAEYQKDKDIGDNFPSWQTISDAIDDAATLSEMKIIVKKMARVLYWLAKNSQA